MVMGSMMNQKIHWRNKMTKLENRILVIRKGVNEMFRLEDEMLLADIKNGVEGAKDRVAKLIDAHFDGDWEYYKIFNENKFNYIKVHHKFNRSRD